MKQLRPPLIFHLFLQQEACFRLFAEAYVTQAGFFTTWTGRETSWKQFHVTMKLTRWLRCCYGIHIARCKLKDGSIVWMFCESFDIACLFQFPNYALIFILFYFCFGFYSSINMNLILIIVIDCYIFYTLYNCICFNLHCSICCTNSL